MKKTHTQISWKPGQKILETKTDINQLKKMSDEEAEKSALEDEDNQPLTIRELSQFKTVHPPEKINVKSIREALHISQDEFAQYFGVNVRTIQDWEQGRHNPGRTARNFLTVIAMEPYVVQKALRKGLKKEFLMVTQRD